MNVIHVAVVSPFLSASASPLSPISVLHLPGLSPHVATNYTEEMANGFDDDNDDDQERQGQSLWKTNHIMVTHKLQYEKASQKRLLLLVSVRDWSLYRVKRTIRGTSFSHPPTIHPARRWEEWRTRTTTHINRRKCSVKSLVSFSPSVSMQRSENPKTSSDEDEDDDDDWRNSKKGLNCVVFLWIKRSEEEGWWIWLAELLHLFVGTSGSAFYSFLSLTHFKC